MAALAILILADCSSLNMASTPQSSRSGWEWLGTKNVAARTGEVFATSCASATFCVATGGYRTGTDTDPGPYKGGWASTFNGAKWSAQSVVGENFKSCASLRACDFQGKGLQSVACSSAHFCMAIDTVSKAFRFDGNSWTEMPLNYGLSPVIYQGTASDLTCPSAAFCMAENNIQIADTFNGTSWGAPSKAPPTGNVWCRSATDCIGFGTGFNGINIGPIIYGYDGNKWSQLDHISADGWIATPFCLDTKTCAFSNGIVVPLPGYDRYFDYISCASASFCMALTLDSDQNFTAYSEYNGRRWLPSRPLPHIWGSQMTTSDGSAEQGWNSDSPPLRCSSPHFCLLVSASGQTWVWHGAN